MSKMNQNLLFVLETPPGDLRYYWSVRALVTAFVRGYGSHPRSNVHMFVRNGQPSIPVSPLPLLREAARTASTEVARTSFAEEEKRTEKQVIDNYTKLIKHELGV